MSRFQASDTQTHELAEVVRRFCELCSTLPKEIRATDRAKLLEGLLLVCAKCSRVPPTFHDLRYQPMSSPVAAPPGLAGLESIDTYWMIFDPYRDSEAVQGSLVEDLAEVLEDLHEGLDLWDRGALSMAVGHWTMTFAIHWGRHAIAAAFALYSVDSERLLD